MALLRAISVMGNREWTRVQKLFEPRTKVSCQQRWYKLKMSLEQMEIGKCPVCGHPAMTLMRRRPRKKEDTPEPFDHPLYRETSISYPYRSEDLMRTGNDDRANQIKA
jgi:hypothetical protein